MIDEIEVLEPVSYTHLDVYKRQWKLYSPPPPHMEKHTSIEKRPIPQH